MNWALFPAYSTSEASSLLLPWSVATLLVVQPLKASAGAIRRARIGASVAAFAGNSYCSLCGCLVQLPLVRRLRLLFHGASSGRLGTPRQRAVYKKKVLALFLVTASRHVWSWFLRDFHEIFRLFHGAYSGRLDWTAACSIKKKVLELILATVSLKKRRQLY